MSLDTTTDVVALPLFYCRVSLIFQGFLTLQASSMLYGDEAMTYACCGRGWLRDKRYHGASYVHEQ